MMKLLTTVNLAVDADDDGNKWNICLDKNDNL